MAGHKNTVAELLVSEACYRRLFETAPDGILILDAETGQVVDANPFLKDLLGYSKEEFLGRKLWEIGPFKGEDASKSAFAQLQKTDRLHYAGMPLETKDGRRVEVEFISSAYMVEGTRLIQCNIRDITERNRVSKALESANKELAFQVEEKGKRADELALIVEERTAANNELAFQVEEKGKRADELALIVEERLAANKELAFQVEEKSKRAEELALLVEERLSANKELAYQVYEKSKRADELAVIVEERLEANKELAFQVEEKGKRADELVLIVEERLAANKELAFQVEEKSKRAEELALLVEQRLAANRELAFQVEEKSKRADELALIVEERTAANKELAFQVGEKGKRADELALIVEERLAANKELAFQVKEKDKRADELALIVEERLAANKELAFQVEEKGKRADELALIVEERLAANIELAYQVEEKGKRADELDLLNVELARSNLELDQFAYVATHDLQEPLRAVTSCVQLLQKNYEGQLDARAQEFITHAVDGNKRMQTLITDLLAYSRISTHAKAFAPTNIESVLDGVLANLSVAIAESEAVVTREAMPVVNGDTSQLAQLFQNLIANAVKFRGKDPTKIHIGAVLKDGEWWFSVADNGIGMEPQFFERVFQVFQRLHTRREYSGTGIGLAICKKVVERHGGRIWVESEYGHGAKFCFTIPERT